jgi:hypothetical protein
MIRAIDNKPLELSDAEFEYYIKLVDAFGTNVFQKTFEVDEKEDSQWYGFITLVTPPMDKNLPLGVIFFLMNCMLNQRVREFEKVMMLHKNK